MYNCSRWIMMNVVMLDEKRVIVSAGRGAASCGKLKEWGFEPIECPFWDFETIGGGFHCATVDIAPARRAAVLLLSGGPRRAAPARQHSRGWRPADDAARTGFPDGVRPRP